MSYTSLGVSLRLAQARQNRAKPRLPANSLSGMWTVLGSVEAQFHLGASYEFGENFPKDEARARQYFRMCATRGEAPCQFRLSLLLKRPERTERLSAGSGVAGAGGEPVAMGGATKEPVQPAKAGALSGRCSNPTRSRCCASIASLVLAPRRYAAA
jgi:TPR repeat protein